MECLLRIPEEWKARSPDEVDQSENSQLSTDQSSQTEELDWMEYSFRTEQEPY